VNEIDILGAGCKKSANVTTTVNEFSFVYIIYGSSHGHISYFVLRDVSYI